MEKIKIVKVDEKEVEQKIYDWYCNQTVEEEEVEKVLGLSLERIMFMKQYFKERGFNPESEDFEQMVLRKDTTQTVKPIYTPFKEDEWGSYTYTGNPNITITYTITTGED